jgi:hypothetical protein
VGFLDHVHGILRISDADAATVTVEANATIDSTIP